MVNTGTRFAAIWPEDLARLQEWLTTNFCEGNTSRQGLILNGDDMTFARSQIAPALRAGTTGASLVADAYHEGGDENDCVRLATPSGGGRRYGTSPVYQNVPNPFNPRTVLRFSLAQTGPVELTIFDVNGRKIREVGQVRPIVGVRRQNPAGAVSI